MIAASPSSTGRRRAARGREYRQLRILAMAPAGWSYAAIGREAAIARERLLAKLNAMAETIQRRRERHGEAPPDGVRSANRRGRP